MLNQVHDYPVPAATCAGHRQAVNACCWSPDGRYLCTAASDKTCLVWDMTSLLPEAASAATPTATPPAPATAAAANAGDDDDNEDNDKGDGGGRKNEAGDAGQPPLAPLCAITGHEDYVQALAWSPCGTKIATGCDGAVVRLWDATALLTRAQVCAGHSATPPHLLVRCRAPHPHFDVSAMPWRR